MISAGGALGGTSVSLIAPLIFKTYAEWKIGLVVGFVLAMIVAFILTDWQGWKRPTWNSRTLVRVAGIVVTLIALPDVVYILQHEDRSRFKVIEQTRNFYGVLTVLAGRPDKSDVDARLISHGSTLHGFQFIDPKAGRRPTAYFTEISGVGQTLEYYKEAAAREGKPLRIGVVGLGAGLWRLTLPGPDKRFVSTKSIPKIAALPKSTSPIWRTPGKAARRSKSFWGTPGYRWSESWTTRSDSTCWCLDGFNSDSPPIHLLTKEAFEVYREHLAPQGAIAANITNRYLNLAPIVFGVAESIGLDPVEVMSFDDKPVALGAEWVILSRNQELLDKLRAAGRRFPTTTDAATAGLDRPAAQFAPASGATHRAGGPAAERQAALAT